MRYLTCVRMVGTRAAHHLQKRLASTTSKSVPKLGETEEEMFVSPSLKKFFNRTSIAMQTPDMTRKYAESSAPLIPSFFLGKVQLVSTK